MTKVRENLCRRSGNPIFPKIFRRSAHLCYNACLMGSKFIRVYQKHDIHEIKAHVLIYGDLAANCGHCNALNVPLEAAECPECKASYKYIAFRNVAHHLPKLAKLSETRPDLVFVDYDDFKRALGAAKAEEFLQ